MTMSNYTVKRIDEMDTRVRGGMRPCAPRLL